ncbi:MAG: SPASM domain-containing protein [Chlamydiae bacterium]|nr:SPASM domain-containing protein [Chlamydiota bacterium]
MSLPLFQEVHIENTNSCGYKCVMCPRESQTRRIGFMPLEDFSFLLERIGPFQGVFHLHGFGEPLLDRQLIQKVQELKEKSPSSLGMIFSTLGVRIAEDYFEKLLAAGLDLMVISLYGFASGEYKKIHGYDGFELVKRNLQLLSKAMKQHPKFKANLKIPSSAISSILPIAEASEKVDFCRWVEKLGFAIGEWDYVHNYSDGRNYNLPDITKICPVISGKRKNILNITWDLNVIPCCYDYNATISFGNLRKQSLEEIFASPEYLAFVIAHQTGSISAYPVCQNCEKRDYE